MARAGDIDAVIFDWGGTLTPWLPPDAEVWTRVVARLADPPLDAVTASSVAAVLAAAEDRIWARTRDEHRSGTLEEIFTAAGLAATAEAHRVYAEEVAFATHTDPQAADMLRALRGRGLRVGVLSNTTWPRAQHEEIFRRDAVLDLIDGAVYTSEIPWTKPHPEAFRAAMAAIGVADPARCVFVGDRTFDDIHGAQGVGMRTVLVPHSDIPAVQRGHTDGVPDAVIRQLSDLVAVVDGWRDGWRDGG